MTTACRRDHDHVRVSDDDQDHEHGDSTGPPRFVALVVAD